MAAPRRSIVTLFIGALALVVVPTHGRTVDRAVCPPDADQAAYSAYEAAVDPSATALPLFASASPADSGAPPLLSSASLADSVATALPPAVGDSLDLDRFADHPRVASYLRYFQGPGRPTMTRLLRRGAAYLPMIRDRLVAAELPTDLGYLALIESGFTNNAVSRKGAVGMWQFMPATARAYGLRVDGRVDERRDPIKATDAAVRHLSDLKNRFGSIYLAAAAYNAGADRVSRGLERLRELDNLRLDDDTDPGSDGILDGDSLGVDTDFFRLSDARLLAPETANYVPQLIAAALIAKDPARYSFRITGEMPEALLEGPSIRPHVKRPIEPRSKMTPGRRSARARHVLVRRGDTVGDIAQQYQVSEREMRRINALPKNYRLRPGQILRLPES